MISRFIQVAALSVIVTTAALAKEASPQFRNICPLPGAGVAINALGKPDGFGAIQMNIPVAYTPGEGYTAAGSYWGNHPHVDEPFGQNGTGMLSYGMYEQNRLYISGMWLSRELKDTPVWSAQAQINEQTGDGWSVAFGAQDLGNKEKLTTGRSYYGVATKALGSANKPIYLTVGYGDGRFIKKTFGGISMPVSDSLNLFTEYDGEQINAGAGFRPGGRKGSLTITGGYNQGVGWMIGASMTFSNK